MRDFGEDIVRLYSIRDARGGELAARRTACELDEDGGARREPAQCHGAEAITRAFADVRDQRVERGRGVIEILQPAMIDRRIGAQRQVEGRVHERSRQGRR